MKKILTLLYAPYRYLIFAPLMVVSTLFFGALTVLLITFLSPRKVSFISGTLWARLNSYLTPMFVKVYGRENADPGQSYVVVANHQSHYDIFVLYGWLGLDFKWVMKKELRRVPALGLACEKLGHIFIDRSNNKAAVAALERARKIIVNGTSVLFFPEGTRSRTGELGQFKKGAFIMALDLGLPILPVSIINTENVLPPKSLKLIPGRARLVIHKPLDITPFSPQDLETLMTKARGVIQSGLERHAI